MTRIYAVLAFLGLLPEPALVHVRISAESWQPVLRRI